MTDNLTLTVNGQIYDGWTSVKVTRSIEHAAADFDISVTERWATGAAAPPPWQIPLYASCVLAIDGTSVLTGYVERYEPSYSATEHKVRVAGRSKTCDVVDCMPALDGQFNGYTLDAVARAMCAPFGVNVIVQCPMGAPFPQAMIEKTETAHAAIDKLSRLRQVLVCDDASGNLVLTQAGAGGAAATSLVEGGNILSANAKLGCNERFKDYYVLSQAPLAFNGQSPQLQVLGHASDSSCPRARRFAEHAEHAADPGEAQARAKWRALHNAGKSIEATVEVLGWSQTPGGPLWAINQTVAVASPRLELARSLLVGTVEFTLDDKGRRTKLTLAPQEAFIPEPTQQPRAGAGNNDIWQGVQKIS